MKNRIKQIRKENNLTQVEFGERIAVRGNTITNYETGLRNPTDVVILSICREFNINEEWLRYGKEPKYNIIEDKLSSYLGQIAKGNDDFIKSLIEVYMELDPDSKKALRTVANQMADRQRKGEQK